MKIALVGLHSRAADGPPSGLRTAALAAALTRNGAEVSIFGVGSRRTRRVSSTAGYRAVEMPFATSAGLDDATKLDGDAAVAASLRDFARFLDESWSKDRPDVVHANGWIHGVAAQLAADRHQLPTVQTLSPLSFVSQQRQHRSMGPPARTRFEKLLARSAHRIVVTCSDDIGEVARLGCPRSRVSVLARGIDVDEFATVGPVAELGAMRRIIAVGSNLLPYKGFDDAIVATSRLRNAELVIVGGPRPRGVADDPDVARLREVAAAHGVTRRVHFTGMLPRLRIPTMLRSADVLVCPSWYESVGSAVVEAMACGVPVVASEAGGMRDSVIHEITGLHVPPRNPARLALALKDVLDGGALGSGMGLAGRSRARACFSWDRVAAEATTIYARAVETRQLLCSTAG